MATKNTPKAARDKARQRARDYLIDYKSCHACVECGVQYPFYCMDFDHVRGRKKFELWKAVTNRYSIETIEEEIRKCEVVCKNCHAKRTYIRNLPNNNELKISPI